MTAETRTVPSEDPTLLKFVPPGPTLAPHASAGVTAHLDLADAYESALADEGLSRFDAQKAAQEVEALIQALIALGYPCGEIYGRNADERKSREALWSYIVPRFPFVRWLQAQADRLAKEAIVLEAERKALYERIQLTRALTYAGRDPWTTR